MGEWLGWTCVAIMMALPIMQLVGRIFSIKFRREWRAVLELWCLDWLDINVRVEREFGVELAAPDFESGSVEARWGDHRWAVLGVGRSKTPGVGSARSDEWLATDGPAVVPSVERQTSASYPQLTAVR